MNRRDVLAGGVLGTGTLGGVALAGCLGTGSDRENRDEADDSHDGSGVPNGDDGDRGGEGDGSSYEPLARLPLPSAYEAVVDAAGTTAYVAGGDRWYAIDLSAPESPAVVTERGNLLADHDAGPMEAVWDCKVDGDDLLVVGPAHPRSDVVDAAVRYDVSDPASPDLRAVHVTDYPIHNCDVADGIAYLTGNTLEGNPVVIVDLEGPDGDSAEIARWSVVDVDPAWADVESDLRPIHDVWVHDGVAYAAYWDAGTHLLDVSNPADPTHLGGIGPYEPGELIGLSGAEVRRERLAPPGNHHFAAPNEDGTLLAVNEEAWAVDADGDRRGAPGGILLYDIADPTDPVELATIEAPPSPDPTVDGVWTTSHNFELRGDRLYSSWYEGGVRVHDVSDPTDPSEIASWRDPAVASFWTAQVGIDGQFFVATSTGHRPTEPAIYTFPTRRGEQSDPPPMEAATRDGE